MMWESKIGLAPSEIGLRPKLKVFGKDHVHVSSPPVLALAAPRAIGLPPPRHAHHCLDCVSNGPITPRPRAGVARTRAFRRCWRPVGLEPRRKNARF